MRAKGLLDDPVCAVIRAGFESTGKTQAGLAIEVDVSQVQVSRWTRGENRPPPFYWPEIEEYLNLAPTALARAAGFFVTDNATDIRLKALEAEVERLSKLVGTLADLLSEWAAK